MHRNMIFLVSSGKMIFLLPENILFFRRKMKNDLSQKKYMEIWYFLQMFCKIGLSEKTEMEYDLSYIMRKDAISFSWKYDIVLRTENERRSFSTNIWKYDVFCMLVKVAFLFPTNMKWSFCQKSKDELFPKNGHKDDISGITEKDGTHPRKDDIGILDLNSRKSSNGSCTFMETFLSVFIYCFPIKKETGNLTYRIKIWLSL